MGWCPNRARARVSELNVITLALPKGRIFEETLPLIRAASIEVLEDPNTSRKLILPHQGRMFKWCWCARPNVPTYVAQAALIWGGRSGHFDRAQRRVGWYGLVSAVDLKSPNAV